MKSVRIRSHSGPYFSAFGLNTETYSVSLRIQSECRKVWTRITLNTGTVYAVLKSIKKNLNKGFKCSREKILSLWWYRYFLNPLVPWCSLKGHIYLDKPVAESCRFISVNMTFQWTPGSKELSVRKWGWGWGVIWHTTKPGKVKINFSNFVMTFSATRNKTHVIIFWIRIKLHS